MIPGDALLGGTRLTDGLPEEVVERLAAAMNPVHVSGGQWLFHQGDAGDALFLILGGRIEVVRSIGGRERVVALLQAGDTLGELALLQGGVRAAGARALRDCDLLRLQRSDFTPLLADPRFAVAMLGHVTKMLRAEPPVDDPAARRAVIAVVAANADAASALVADLAESLDRQHVSAAALRRSDLLEDGADLSRGTSRLLDQMEATHDVVLLDGGDLDGSWARTCARQADRVVVLPPSDQRALPGRREHLEGCDLVLHGDRRLPATELDRLDAELAPRAHHVLRPGHRGGDLPRMARRLSGRALGLVLSGGGARGMAHIGVIQALEEAGIVIDRYGGTSMGAMIGALAATGRPAALIAEVAREEMARRKPFQDWTVPRTSLIRGIRGQRMLRRLFGDTDIRHLARPWFAISADIARAEKFVHRSGPVWDAIACSISLPGMAPPRIYGSRVLVDGGVLDNLPVGVMADDGEGQVVAVDLSRSRDIQASDGPRRIPGIIETLSTTMALSNLQQVDANRQRARLVIEPDVDGVELLDFSTMDDTIAAGHRAATQALAAAGTLSRPSVPR